MHHRIVPASGKREDFCISVSALIDGRLSLAGGIPWVRQLLSAESNSPKKGQPRAGRGGGKVGAANT